MDTRPAQVQVLYVDDELKALTYFTMLFEEHFSIAVAGSVDEALAYLEENGSRVGVVVTDQRMPGKTGVELMEFLRHRYPSIVRVLTTAYSDLDAAIRSVNEGGAFRYLTKPWKNEEMIGALKRAIDYHVVMRERDRLLHEKLSVLHRLIVMDRVRGLTTAVTALKGRLRNAWPALVAYMEQSPVRQKIRVQMEEIMQMNLVAVARREAENMVKTVQSLLKDTVQASTGLERNISVQSLIHDFVAAQCEELSEEDVELAVPALPPSLSLASDRGMLKRLLAILVRRIADMHEDRMRISLSTENQGASSIALSITGDRGDWTESQVASLFSAAIPLQRWPIGLDMDLLSAFLIVHHLGGTLEILPAAPEGPGFRVVLPTSGPADEQAIAEDDWFDRVYESIDEWERSLLAD